MNGSKISNIFIPTDIHTPCLAHSSPNPSPTSDTLIQARRTTQLCDLMLNMYYLLHTTYPLLKRKKEMDIVIVPVMHDQGRDTRSP